MIFEYSVSSSTREELIDITHLLTEAVKEAGIEEGEVAAFVPHTTAAITINENADPSVKRDILTTLRRLIPMNGDYRHSEGNSDAHLKASLFGSSERILVRDGRLLLGTWQGVYFSEFDGPRKRRLHVHVSGE